MFPFKKKVKKQSKYDCIWNEPFEDAPWEFQGCNCPSVIAYTHMADSSCSGVNCGFFQDKKREGAQNGNNKKPD